ncbi:MAG: hypothetical protein JWO30_2253 [Fibrobacteres bacterium]|nr:hypothetical protein [Fibrobacterota bacterium]
MNRYRIWIAFALGLAALPSRADIPIDKIRGEGYTDIGQLVKGNDGGVNVEDHYLSRLGATLTVSDTVNGKLSVRVGVGGIFWQSFPEGDFWQNLVRFGPGITEASTKFQFGRGISVEGGYFPFKYDSPAMNLGEYLLRTESYPTYITTGGWSWVDSAYTRVLGLRLQGDHFGGAFHHELGIYFENQNPPLFDLTPTYVFSWKPAKGLEIGGGGALRRWFSNNRAYFGSDKDEKASLPATQYVEIANFPEVQNQGIVHYSYQDGAGNKVVADTFAVWRGGASLDQSALLAGKAGAAVSGVDMIQDGSPAGMRKGIKKFLMNTKYSDGTNCWDGSSTSCTQYYDADGNLAVTGADGAPSGTAAAQISKQQDITRSAINLMARVGLDFADMLDIKESTGPFKLYAELAVLGVQNQPVYYENVLQRMPLMVGIHVPTFGVLDLLAVETEYLDNPYQDSQQELSIYNREPLPGPSMAIPDLPADDFKKPRFALPSVHGDDLKWSIHAVRTLVPGLKLKVQVANDHLRLQNLDIGGIQPSSLPQTVRKNQWYFITHLDWGF